MGLVCEEVYHVVLTLNHREHVEVCSCAVVREELRAFFAEVLTGRRATGRYSSSVGDRLAVEGQRKVWWPAGHTASCCRVFDMKL